MKIKWISPNIKPQLSGYYLVCFEEIGFSGNYQAVMIYWHLKDAWETTNKDYRGFTIMAYSELPKPPKSKLTCLTQAK